MPSVWGTGSVRVTVRLAPAASGPFDARIATVTSSASPKVAFADWTMRSRHCDDAGSGSPPVFEMVHESSKVLPMKSSLGAETAPTTRFGVVAPVTSTVPTTATLFDSFDSNRAAVASVSTITE